MENSIKALVDQEYFLFKLKNGFIFIFHFFLEKVFIFGSTVPVIFI